MKPILFAPSATAFNTNGLGRLNFISCTVTEERNGMYVLEGTIAEDELHASALEMNSIILAKPNHSSANQAFRVHKIVKPMKGIYSISAEHISYQLSYIPTMPFAITAGSSACANTLAALKSNAAESCPFTFWTDVTTVASYKQTVPASIRSRLGGVEGSVLDQFGGEYEWDNYTVKLHRQRGVQTPNVTLRYGKNIIDLEQEKEINNTITGVCPFWVDSEGANLVTLTEKTVDSSTASSYPFKRTVPLDMSGDWEEAPTESQLRTRAQAYVNASGIGIPKVSIKVSFVNLPDTEEYKDVAALQSVNLCDYVAVQFEKLGINVAAKVVKTVYNVLAERYDSIEVGAIRSSLAETISDQNSEIQSYIDNTRTMFKGFDATIQDDIAGATNWLTSADGYVMARKDANGHWKELLFMDTNNASTAHNVLRINQNGIGFSSNGVNGPFTQAWTLDGKLVIGGTNVPSFTVYDSSNNIIFQTSRSGTIWKSTNSSMSANGTITATSAVLASCTITNGSLTITSGNTTIFSVSSSGITWNLPNSSMTSSGTLTASGAQLNGVFSCGGTYNVKIENGIIKFFKNTTQTATIDSTGSSWSNNPELHLTVDNIRINTGADPSSTWGNIWAGKDNQNKSIVRLAAGSNTINLVNDNLRIYTDNGDFDVNADDRVSLHSRNDKVTIRSDGGDVQIFTDSFAGSVVVSNQYGSVRLDDNGDIELTATRDIRLTANNHVYANGTRID